MTKILFKDEVYAIQGAVFDVYREMGCGFLEPVYQECLEIELKSRGIPFEPQKELRLKYKAEVLNLTYKPDFVCYDTIIVELKAVKEIDDVHRAQIFNYLEQAACGSDFWLISDIILKRRSKELLCEHEQNNETH